MGADIYSYLERRDGPLAAWQLMSPAEIDEEGLYDVPSERQPLRGLRSSSMLAVLTGMISARVELDYARLVSIVPEDRPSAPDPSDELVRICAQWDQSYLYWMTLDELEAIDWRRPVYATDGTSQPLDLYVPPIHDLIAQMRALSRGRAATDVRLVFWIHQ